jgi:imidazolonepropionase-like amidohydrolase
MPADGRRAFLALRDRIVRRLRDRGAKLLAGSDSPQFFMTPGYGLLRELDALREAGLTPYAVLETATRNPAEWLHRADAGTIAAGKRADLVRLDANPLADIANVRRLSGVMVDGRWLSADRLHALKDAVAKAANP